MPFRTTRPSAARVSNFAVEATHTQPWHQSNWLALIEFALVATIFLTQRHLPVSKTPYLLAVGWISMRLRRVSWRSIGLSRYRSWPVTLALGIIVGILMEIFELLISQPLLVRLTGKQPDLSDFMRLHGNIKWTLIALVLVWTLAAFGEEMVWRGYLMNRAAGLGDNTRFAWCTSLIVVSVVFGFAHSYQGVTGVIDEGLMGLILGLVYLGTDRNLSVPIVAHGVADTIDLLLIFLGHYPGL